MKSSKTETGGLQDSTYEDGRRYVLRIRRIEDVSGLFDCIQRPTLDVVCFYIRWTGYGAFDMLGGNETKVLMSPSGAGVPVRALASCYRLLAQQMLCWTFVTPKLMSVV